MTTIDLSQFSIAQMEQLLLTIPAELNRRKTQERAAALRELRELAKAKGFSLDDLVSAGASANEPKRTVAPKYRHPSDSSLTWTGRGRKPVWLQGLLDAGGSLEQFAIQN